MSTETELGRYDLALPYATRFGLVAWLIVVLDVAFIVLGGLPIKIVFAILLLNNVLALTWRRTDAFIEVRQDGLTLLGYGSPFEVAYEEIAEIAAAPELDPISKVYDALARTRSPGVGFNHNVRISLKRWRLGFIVVPILPLVLPLVTKGLWLSLADPDSFATAMKNKLPAVTSLPSSDQTSG